MQSTRQCVMCQQQFSPVGRRQICCSEACQIKRMQDRKKARASGQFVHSRPKDRKPPAILKTCIATHGMVVACSPECRAIRAKRKSTASTLKRSSLKEIRVAKCTVCGQ